MAENAPIIIVIAPLFGALAVILLGSRKREWCVPIAAGALGLALAASLVTFGHVLAHGEFRYRLGGWAPPFGIEYRVDPFSGLVLIAIASIGLLNVFYSITRVREETPEREPYYYTLFLLLLAGLSGMTITNDAFNLYVLIEISALTSYALIAVGSRRAVLASFNYVILGTIGASFYLLGVGYLYMKCGSLNMEDIRSILVAKDLYGSPTIHVAFILIMLGVWVKMAFYPLHGWLPNAYAYAPTTTGTLMGPLVTKVMIYVMIRMMIGVFGVEFVFQRIGWSNAIVWLSVLAIVAGSISALSRHDLRKVLTYLIVAEVGYMVGGAWLANEAGMTGAIFHILSDALMTLCLFFSMGLVILRTGEHRLIAFRGLYRTMPLTMVCFTVGAFSMIGLPPTCGFFSKWYLVQGGIEAGQWGYVIALVFSSLGNAIIFFRLIEMAYFNDVEVDESAAEDPDMRPAVAMEKSPWSMLLPLAVTSAGILLLGIFSGTIISWISRVVETLNLGGGN
jgi:multicomponent Na+:H+ antiporter subunit D